MFARGFECGLELESTGETTVVGFAAPGRSGEIVFRHGSDLESGAPAARAGSGASAHANRIADHRGAAQLLTSFSMTFKMRSMFVDCCSRCIRIVSISRSALTFTS